MKKIVNGLTAIIALVVIIFIALIFSMFSDYGTYEKSNVQLFFTILSSLSIIIIFLFYYSVIEIQENQVQVNEVNSLNNISTLVFSEIPKDIAAADPVFSASLLPGIENDTQVEVTQKIEEQRRVLSIKIFSAWKSYIITPLSPEERTYYNMYFLAWAQSDILFENWSYCFLNYGCATMKFGNMLFRYAREIEYKKHSKKKSEVFMIAAHRLEKENNYINLLIH